MASEALASGATGLSEVLHFRQENEKYEPEVIASKKFDLDIYFKAEPSHSTREKLLILSGASDQECFRESGRDWSVEWKKGLKPFELAPPYWVVPSWCEVPSEAKEVLTIDPGMAFGTGTHETTQLVARLLLKHIPEKPDWEGLDVGTGTGILAMLLQKEGARKVLATEIDKDAAQTATKNLSLNNCKSVQVTTESLEKVSGRFDIVLANIIDGVLTELRDDILRCAAPEAPIILSGILSERESQFRRQFEKEELSLLERETKGEWVGLVYKRRAP